MAAMQQFETSKVPASKAITPKLKSLTLTCLTALGIAAGALSATAQAAPQTLQYNGFVNSPAEQALIYAPIAGLVNAGAFNFSVTNGAPSESFIAYCIELTQSVGNLVSNYETLTMSAYGWSTALQTNIAKLYETGYASSLLDAANSAAFQLALWEVVYETGPYDLSSGTFQATASTNVKNRSASYLAGINAAGVGARSFTVYSSETNQNYLRVVQREGSVPEPGTALLLAGLGLAAFAGRRRGSRAEQSE
jgi:PEP-CTERM motif